MSSNLGADATRKILFHNLFSEDGAAVSTCGNSSRSNQIKVHCCEKPMRIQRNIVLIEK